MEILEEGVGGEGDCCVYRIVDGARSPHNSDTTLKEGGFLRQKGVAW